MPSARVTRFWSSMSDTLDRLPPQRLQWLCLAMTFLLGYLDMRTGYEMSFSVFYLIPVTLVAWYSPGRSCYLHAVFAALVWDVSNMLAGQVWSHPAVYVWNGLTRAAFFVVTAALVQKISLLLEREQAVSRTDHLTGALNARGFTEAFEQEHARSVRARRPWSLLYLDLDHFKEVNDQCGHAEGDIALTKVSALLRRMLRRSDVVARWGGDEFLVLLPETGARQAARVAEKIVLSVRRLSRANCWPLTSSVGVLVNETPGAEDGLEEMIKLADEAMYRAKAQGRDRYAALTRKDGEHALARTKPHWRVRRPNSLAAARALVEESREPLGELACAERYRQPKSPIGQQDQSSQPVVPILQAGTPKVSYAAMLLSPESCPPI